jgi:hypothetical protein
MNEKFKTLKIGKEEYRLVFNTQALNNVTCRYGGLKEMFEKISELEAKESREEYAWLIAELANQGVAIDNDENETETPFITEQKILLYLNPYEFGKATGALIDAINEGMRAETTGDGDDDEDEVLSELKNGEGAAG